MHSRTYRADIQGLRALSVLSVLLFHLDLNTFSGGFVGVDIFFVISGYLITRNIVADQERGRFTFSTFYLKRAQRLFPALFVTVAVTLFTGYLLLNPLDLINLSKSVVFTLLSGANLFFWQGGGYFDDVSNVKPLLNMWSLGVEEQYYLVWPFALVVITNYLNKRQIFAAMLLIIVGSMIFTEFWVTKDAISAFFLTPFRISEFTLGALLVFSEDRILHGGWLDEVLFTIGLGIILYTLHVYSKDTPFPGVRAMLPALGAILIILGGDNKYSSKILSNRIAVVIGAASYSIYLWHWPIISYVHYWYATTLNNTTKWVIVLFTLVTGYLSYRIIENRFHPSFNTQTQSTKPTTFIISCVLFSFAAIVIATTVIWNDGYPWRADAKYASLVSNPAKYHLDHFGGRGFQLIGTLGENTANPSIVFAGDSFAHHLAAGIDQVMKDKRRKAEVIFMHGCLFGPDIFMTEGDNKTCKRAFEKLKDVLLGNELPVVIAESWLHYPGILQTRDKKKIKFDEKNTYDLFLERNIDLIRSTIGINHPLFIVGNPAGGGSQEGVVSCLSRPAFIKWDCATVQKFPREKGAGSGMNQMLMNYAKCRANVHYLDTYEPFCTKNVCYALDHKTTNPALKYITFLAQAA